MTSSPIDKLREALDGLQFALSRGTQGVAHERIAEARTALDELSSTLDRVVTIVDEECGLQPVAPVEDLLTVLGASPRRTAEAGPRARVSAFGEDRDRTRVGAVARGRM